ncbi:hypothetical protein AcW1_009944 [Taiwanofungus camphoratus]|nr:hypothetical protein AcW1_009944 [Antrodia cinnamomea]
MSTPRTSALADSLRLTPQDIASSDRIFDLKLSKDVSRAAYCVGPCYRPGDRYTSALWIAETHREDSAKKITSGTAHDHSPSFHPHSSDIFFLSDRHSLGGATHIYSLPLDATLRSEPKAITSLDESVTITSYSISPDGNYVAFVSRNAPKNSGPKAAVEVWREKTNCGSLHLLHLDSSRSYQTLVSVDTHVDSFTWGADSASIIYRLSSHADAEGSTGVITEGIISIKTGDIHDIREYAYRPGSLLWRQCGDLVFIQNATPSRRFSSHSIWGRTFNEPRPVRLAYGDTEDAAEIIDLGDESKYAVEVATSLDTRLDVCDLRHSRFTAFETADNAVAEWDMKHVGNNTYVFVAVRSSGVTGQPTNIWSGVAEDGKKGYLSKKLSSHHTWFSPLKAPVSEPFHWKSSDGQTLQGVISHPKGSNVKDLPAVVVPHGGPYRRDTLDLRFNFWAWRPFLASRGYLVLSPNYRGSLGRGDSFAAAANGGVGDLDWEDVRTMIDEAISRGLVDPRKLGIAGYSQRGFLTAWGCTRPNNLFKVGVVGAGVSDWGFLAVSSDMPDVEVSSLNKVYFIIP